MKVDLTRRELTLIRVAMIQRMERLKARPALPAQPELQRSYDEMQALMKDDGKLSLKTIIDALVSGDPT